MDGICAGSDRAKRSAKLFPLRPVQSGIMKKSLIKVATALFAVAIATSSFAGKDGEKAKGVGGKVSAVADGTITVANKKLGDKTYKTSADTKVVKADGTAGTLSDIKSGSMIRVTAGAAPDQAASIQIVERKKKEGTQTAKDPAAAEKADE